MSLGFHTVSLLLHDETTAVKELAAMGYTSVAIRPRLSGLNPYAKHVVESMQCFGDAAKRLDVQVVLETQAPFLCDASLASADIGESAKAKAWIDICMQVARDYISDDVILVIESGKSNTSADTGGLSKDAGTGIELAGGKSADEEPLERLAFQIDTLLRQADSRGLRLAIRPRTGNVIAKVTHFQRLCQWLGGPHRLYLAADTAQMMIGGEFPIGERLALNASELACVFLTDPETTSVASRNAASVSDLPGRVDLSRVVQSIRRQEILVPMIVQIDGQSERGLEIAREAWAKL
ncbi:TIM barrel protein [Planctomycetes bacterium K23_9]|uniref:Xylose isomerase-like TIM barrel n=1 Tax=Stieleria marina TaxID=1930275 RepID=A0A517NPQ2_9BACT|nr:Xylose isomerase-like TIM barrel [Planctomycetes bacterium K23_9]